MDDFDVFDAHHDYVLSEDVDDDLREHAGANMLQNSAARLSNSANRDLSRTFRQMRNAQPPSFATPFRASRSEAATFNPEAAEFVPRRPSKRKATSSVRPDKLPNADSLPTSRSAAVLGSQSNIPWNEIFGPGSQTAAVAASPESINDISDSDDFSSLAQEALDLQVSGDLQIAQRLIPRNDPLNKSTSYKPTMAVGHTGAAILFMHDGMTSPSESSPSDQWLRYLPLGPEPRANRGQSSAGNRNFTVLRSHRRRIDGATASMSSSQLTWAPNKLPVEMFDLITSHLSRDDIKSMRLVSKEFEKKVSCTLFQTSVVPFNTELYDMIEEDTKTASRGSRAPNGKGKGRARDLPEPFIPERLSGGLHWQNARDDAEGKVYRGHGLRVFQGFGPHIKHFGMSFDVSEKQLSRPPIKKELAQVESYFGSYDWPHQQYTRFANLAGLEKTADETLRMKAAFANLGKVQELALSMDSGLGWLEGPDQSIRARIFDRPTPVFGASRFDNQMQSSKDFWEALRESHRSNGLGDVLKEAYLTCHRLSRPPSEVQGLDGSSYGDSSRWLSIPAKRVMSALVPAQAAHPCHGVLYMSNSEVHTTPAGLCDRSSLVPSELRKEQKEWLLETEWAQRAFLECYMLAVIDNSSLFANVKKLNLAKLSSSFLPLVARGSFWDALPGITDVTVHVKPDWRTVEKDDAGYAEASQQDPSEAVREFHGSILRDRLCLRPSVKRLNLGWVGGGEHAEGMFARNTNILPCPVTPLEHSTANNANSGLVFRFVEELTLTNCWLTPIALEGLVKNHAGTSLKTLILDSVSLTAHPRFAAGNQQQQLLQQQQQQLLQQQLNPNPNPNPAQPTPIAPLLGGPIALQNAPPTLGQGHAAAAAQLQAQIHTLVQQLGQQQQHQQVLQQAHAALGQQPGPYMNVHGHAQAAAQLQAQIIHLHQQMAAHQQHHQTLQQAQAALQAVQAPPAFNPPQAAAAAAQNPNMQQNPPAPSHWSEGHREGSWPEVLNTISPGPIFQDYLPQPQPWEEQHPPRDDTNLQTIEFKSCGYAKLLNNPPFDQLAIEAMDNHHFSPWFRARQHALSSAMMTTTDRYIARIVQEMPQRESNALLFAWALTEGWDDREKAEEAEYDGLLAGGTGRFSGTIDAEMALIGQPAPAAAKHTRSVSNTL